MSQKIRQEINFTDATTGTSSASVFPLTFKAELDTAKFSGSPTYYFEFVYKFPVGTTSPTVRLRRSGTTTDDVNVTSGFTIDNAWHILRSTAFSPPAGATDYIPAFSSDGTHAISFTAFRIIILQDETAITKTSTQIEIGNYAPTLSNTSVADITNPKFWKYTSANWDGTKTFSVEVVWQTSAKNTCTITLCRTSDNAANVTVVNAGSSSTSTTRTRVSFTPVDGETYKLRSLGSTSKSTYDILSGKIVVDQTNTPTKLEPQFLLLNTGDAGTGAQNMLTTYNSSEWNAGSGTITITHLMDSDNASNSAKIVTLAGADTGSSSAATGTGQQASSAFTLIDATTYDTNVTNSTGVVAASRLKLVYAFVAEVARRIFVTGG